MKNIKYYFKNYFIECFVCLNAIVCSVTLIIFVFTNLKEKKLIELQMENLELENKYLTLKLKEYGYDYSKIEFTRHIPDFKKEDFDIFNITEAFESNED